jgi:hypothetical protein
MDYYAEVEAVQSFRRVTGLNCAEKRRRIAELTVAMDVATHTPAVKAAGMLPAIWAARISLDWGCRPVVGR